MLETGSAFYNKDYGLEFFFHAICSKVKEERNQQTIWISYLSV